MVEFTGTPTLTHHATNLPLPNNANILVEAGDKAIFARRGSAGSGQWDLISYLRKSGRSLVGAEKLQANPANPTGTSSATKVHMGVGQTFTPRKTGNILCIISGTCGTVTNKATTISLRYGTGSAPANGAAETGSSGNADITCGNASANADGKPFSLNSVISGLTIGTAIWVDFSAALSTAGGTTTFSNISISIVEI